MRKHYVTFYSPGTLVAETSRREIGSWDPKVAIGMAETIQERYGATPYGFVFSTNIVRDPVPDGEGGMLKVEPKEAERSGMHFIGGRLETLDEVEARNDPKESILRSNMRGNGMWIVCLTTRGHRSTMPFEEGDVVVDAKGTIVKRGDMPELVRYRTEKQAEREAAR